MPARSWRRRRPAGLLLGLDADPEALEVAAKHWPSAAPTPSSWRRTSAPRVDVPPAQVRAGARRSVRPRPLIDAARGREARIQLPGGGAVGHALRTRPDSTAADIVNEYKEADLANVIWQFGEEAASRRIARAIVRARPVRTTELASTVSRAVPGPRRRIHPATRTFQALRIAVNDELRCLRARSNRQ